MQIKIDIKKWFTLAFDIYEDKECIYLEQEYDGHNGGLEHFKNPFQACANSIYYETKSLIEERNGINLFYCLSLFLSLLKLKNSFHCSQGPRVMIPI